MHSEGDKYMDWHVGKEMADYLTAHGCTVKTEFNDWGNHVYYGLFEHTFATMLLMEDFMPETENFNDQLKNDIIDKANKYFRDNMGELSGITL